MGQQLGLTSVFSSSGPAAPPSFGTAGTYRAGTTATPQFAVPSSVANNDIILVVMYIDGTSANISALPTGFAQHPDFPYTLTGIMNHRLAVAWKRASGADAGTYDFTLSSSVYSEGCAFRWTGCKTSGTPFDLPSGGDVSLAQNTTNSTTTPAVNVTTLGANRAFLHVATDWSGGTWTAPSGFTKRGAGGGSNLVYLSDKTQATAANSGATSATCTGNDKMTAWIGALIGA
jgi:hypothetical protein